MHSLTLALGGGEWSASRPSRFTPKERAPGTHWIGGWVGHSAGGDEKNSQPLPGLEPPIIQPVAQRYTTELERNSPYFLNIVQISIHFST
jgi:hypothetical protein